MTTLEEIYRLSMGEADMSHNPRPVIFANAIKNMRYSDELREIGETMRRIARGAIATSNRQDYAELLYLTAEHILAEHKATHEQKSDI